jgi:hypothetical protein
VILTQFGIATGPRCGRSGIASGKRKRFFSFLHGAQTVSGAHLVSYPTGIRGSFAGVKEKGREAYHATPSSAEV